MTETPKQPSSQAPVSEAEVEAINWYHTIALPGGVVSHGYYDLRAIPDRIGFPESLAGKRCLDIGTADGFWAFEMERRGAKQVVAIDVDDPARWDWSQPQPKNLSQPGGLGPRKCFLLARRALGSRVERVNASVYDLPSLDLGEFDFAFMGSMMLHLRDPIGALTGVSRLLQPTNGTFLSADSIALMKTIAHPFSATGSLRGTRNDWWTPNLRGYRRMLTAAGFEIVDSGGPFFIPFGEGFPTRDRSQPRRIDRRTPSRLAFSLVTRRLGAASAWALCRPIGG